MLKAKYLIALGSNQRHHRFGRPVQVLKTALQHLDKTGLKVTAASKIIQSRPIGPSIRTYANAAAIIESNLMPLELLAKLKGIEVAFGKRRGQRWSSRVLDLDIILSSRGLFHSGSPWLCIPHTAMRERSFVLQPAAEIAPDWNDPITGLTIRHLVYHLNRAKPLDRSPNQH